MKKLLIPHIRLTDLPVMIKFTFIGAIIAGTYGIIHDQITFAIGPEYFHNFKFRQFAHSNIGLPDRLFVSQIGFQATWWVGAIVGWILSRRIVPRDSSRVAAKKISRGFLIVMGAVFIGGLLGYAYGLWRGPDADYSMWNSHFIRFQVSDHWNFMRVGYIHNAGYLGAVCGLILTFVFIRPDASPQAEQSSPAGRHRNVP